MKYTEVNLAMSPLMTLGQKTRWARFYISRAYMGRQCLQSEKNVKM